jgi:hypothetical protein
MLESALRDKQADMSALSAQLREARVAAVTAGDDRAMALRSKLSGLYVSLLLRVFILV